MHTSKSDSLACNAVRECLHIAGKQADKCQLSPVVLRVYSDQATIGTAASPARPAARCPALCVPFEAPCC